MTCLLLMFGLQNSDVDLHNDFIHAEFLYTVVLFCCKYIGWCFYYFFFLYLLRKCLLGGKSTFYIRKDWLWKKKNKVFQIQINLSAAVIAGTQPKIIMLKEKLLEKFSLFEHTPYLCSHSSGDGGHVALGQYPVSLGVTLWFLHDIS